MKISELQARRLVRDDPSARALAAGAGVHGVYVQNALNLGQHDGLVFDLAGVECGLAWFGPRGNLVIISDGRLDGYQADMAERIGACPWPWRFALGPQPVVDFLAEFAVRTPLAQRDQIYYVCSPVDAPEQMVRADVRCPDKRDRERLARAMLALNASDLNVAPSSVDRRWLYNMIDSRIRNGSTRVLGPIGTLWSKLDYGSDGPAGAIIEGVFTFPDRRGQGLGAELVATCIAQSGSQVSLHVSEDNRAARSAYERAGMRQVGSCRLLLLS